MLLDNKQHHDSTLCRSDDYKYINTYTIILFVSNVVKLL